jgi:hypothetical protein
VNVLSAAFVNWKESSRFESTLTPPETRVNTFVSSVIVASTPLGDVLGDAETLEDGDGLEDVEAETDALGVELGDVEGDVDGVLDAEADGDVDGDVLGVALAEVDGELLGDGLDDGLVEGDAETDVEGVLDADADGVLEGDADTDVLGLALTLVLGDDDGDADGVALGDVEGEVEGDDEGLDDPPATTRFPRYRRNMDHAVVGMLMVRSSHSAPAASMNWIITLSAFISVDVSVTFTQISDALSTAGSVPRLAGAPLSFLTFTSPDASVGFT